MSTLSKLLTPIAACLESINSKSSDGFINTLSEKIVLIDEGKTYNGHDPIRKWCNEALIGHGANIDIKGATNVLDHTIVHLIMDGDFVADYNITEPFPLYFDFVVKDNSITFLKITPNDPSMATISVDEPNMDNPTSTVRYSRRLQQPTPEGWVRVKMHAVGLNYHDIFTMRGIGMHPIAFPQILGCEGAGVLDDGTEVLIYPVMGDVNFKGDETLDPKRNVFSELTAGTLSEFVNVPRRNAVVRPKELAVEAAAVMGIAWLTAYRMLVTRAGLRAGQVMLVQGSSGGVTSALIQLGAAAGIRVWCTGRSVEKRELGLKLGAERAFLSGEELPEKVDAVFDTSGEVTWEHSMNSVKVGGTIVTCGGHAGRAISVDVSRIFVQQLNVRGSYLGTLQEFHDLISFVLAKSIKPHIGLVLPIERAEEGFRKMVGGETAGKIVVTI